MTPQQSSVSSSRALVAAFMWPGDRVTKYALDVHEGRLVAGKPVRDACLRHLKDLQWGHERGLRWDPVAAERVERFFKTVLTVDRTGPKLSPDDPDHIPFLLLDWQFFIIGSVFGWKQEDGSRRFRTVYCETGKGSGKSPMAAGVGIYCMVADGEPRAEVYAAATKKEQAMVLFRDAVTMVNNSVPLADKIRKSGREPLVWNLYHPRTGSFFRPIVSKEEGTSGPRPACGLLDEVHEHPDNSVVELMRAGVKHRSQPIIFMITNSGTNKQSVCYEYHKYGEAVCAGDIVDDSFFAYICSLDLKDPADPGQGLEDPFEDEACWPKVNPSLGVTIKPQYLRDQVTQARGMPSKESIVRRLNFCEWVESLSPWLSKEVWKNAYQPFELEDMVGRRAVASADLSSTTDLTAFVLTFEPTPEDPLIRLWPFFWIPFTTDAALDEKAKRDGVPYRSWIKQGWLRTTNGPAVNKRAIVVEMLKLRQEYRIRLKKLVFDRWRISDLQVLLDEEGFTNIEMIPHGQGYADMSPSVEEFETALLNGRIAHNGNPVMTWNAANAVVVQDPAANRKPSKEHATGRIDGIVAAVMGVHEIVGTKKTRRPGIIALD